MTHAEYLTKISNHLRSLDEIPLFGKAPFLELETLSSLLAKALNLGDFSLHIKTQQWVKKEDLLKKNNQALHSISIAPIPTPVYWTMKAADLTKLTSLILLHKHKKKAFASPLLQEGYYRFLLLEAMHAAQNLSPIQQMTLSLEEEEEMILEDALSMKVEISCEEHTIWGQLIIPKSFQHNWVQHFSAFPSQSMARKQKIPVEVGLEVGSVRLSQKEWSKLKSGDFLLPDSLLEGGDALLCLGDFPLFHVHIEGTKMELKEYAFTIEDTMDKSENTPASSLGETLDLAEQETKAIQDIPLYVHIELAKLKVTLNQLMNLSPGNFLELPMHSSQAVSLTINGQKVGSAELVQLGETLGLKILEIG